MYLVIDIGNTMQKAAVFGAAGEIVRLEQASVLDEALLADLCKGRTIRAALISSVGDDALALADRLRRRCPVALLSDEVPLPIDIRYDSRRTLGSDRIACAIAANNRYPGAPVLAIQAGTCLVTDFVTADGVYLGGTIAPGLRMRLQALHNYTRRLPQIEPQPIDFLIGSSTQKSILSGVLNGMGAEIDGLIERYTAAYPDLKVLLTGGDAPLLSNSIKNSIFAAPNLVLYGLYKILDFNAKKNI